MSQYEGGGILQPFQIKNKKKLFNLAFLFVYWISIIFYSMFANIFQVYFSFQFLIFFAFGFHGT
jgi:accessory gene regulator protein AgrB